MVLDIAQVEANLPTGRDAVRLIAALGEAFDDVGFPTEKTHERIVLLPAITDLLKKVPSVFATSDEDCIFDRIGFMLDRVDGRSEGIDNIIATWQVSMLDFNEKEVGLPTSWHSRSSLPLEPYSL